MTVIQRKHQVNQSNLQNYVKMPIWKGHEAISLINGMDPFNYTHESFQHDAKDLLDRQTETLKRDVVVGQGPKRIPNLYESKIDRMEVYQDDFLRWAYDKGFEIHQPLIDARTEFKLIMAERESSNPFAIPTDWKGTAEKALIEVEELKALIETQKLAQKANEEGLHAKVKFSYQKLILGMAKAKYGFDPLEERSKATGSIHRDLANLDLSLDEKTILKRLRESADELRK